MAVMRTLDRVIEELRRAGGNRLVLVSDSEPVVTTAEGDRTLDYRVGHKDLIALVEGIVPAARFADLVMMESVTFDVRPSAGDVKVHVIPGPSIWRVTFSVLGERLEPLPAAVRSDDASESPSSAPGGPGHGEDEGEVEGEDPIGDHPLIASPDPSLARAPSGQDQPPGPRQQGVAGVGDEAGAPEPDDELDLEGFVVGDVRGSARAYPTFSVSPSGNEASSSDSEADKPAESTWSRASLEGALVRSRKTSELEVHVTSEAEERSRRGDSFATGSTIQLSADDLAALADRTVSVALGDPAEAPGEPAPSGATPSPEPEAPEEAEDAPDAAEEHARTPTGSFAPVQPIEIELHDEDTPRVQIEALDRLLRRAFEAGATSVLLRDRRVPAMAMADKVQPLPGARPEDGSLVQKILDLAASPSHVGRLDIEGFCRFVYRPAEGSDLVRCTLVRDGGAVAAWLRRIGDEHLPVQASRWLPASVRNAMPESGLVLVAGPSGHGKTTTATALAALCQQTTTQTLVVADPLERRLPADAVGILQRQIPDDVPSAGRALGDALRLEARLVLVDIPRPEGHALEILTLASQGRLVLCTWVAPDGTEAVEGLLDSLPPSMSPVERSRRARSLRAVVTVKLVPGRERGVEPIFEILPVSDLFLEAVSHGRLSPQTAGKDLLSLSFEASLASLKSRGLI